MNSATKPHILITSGPTRQYLDPVRFLSNASSGKMGAAIATAALDAGFPVTVISGPVDISYPNHCTVIHVDSTQQMLDAAAAVFPECGVLIGAAAPCDYMPVVISSDKIKKTGEPLNITLSETPDIIATLAASKTPDQVVIGFALETTDHRFRALRKLEEKCCDYIVLNEPSAMNSTENSVRIFDANGEEVATASGSKLIIGELIIGLLRNTT